MMIAALHKPAMTAARKAWVGALLALACAAPAAAWSESGRLLYVLNCMGCHPVQPDDGTGFHSAGFSAQFRQSPRKRSFFIRMPQASQALSPQENRELVAEVLAWAKACPQLPPGAPLTRPELAAPRGEGRP